MNAFGPPHMVRALLSHGWHEQACASAAEAVSLFERLRAYEGVTLERVEHGRVVEIRKGSVEAQLRQLAVRTPLAA